MKLPARRPLILLSLLIPLFTQITSICAPASAAASEIPAAIAAQAAAPAADHNPTSPPPPADRSPTVGGGPEGEQGGGITSFPPNLPAQAQDLDREAALPDQYGISAEYGYVYDPDQDLSFLMARLFAIYDYGTVWRQDRPKALRFKVEGAIGSTVTPDADLMVSANIIALYYPGKISGRTLRPYLEGGIGVIYTGFRVQDQAYHFNFNPLLGIGCELPQKNGKHPFAALRLHHLSNGGLSGDNRGVNSVVLQVGRYF